ncbi:prephenate dehydrogenase/arogenate dehydrogenase family protein [Dehalococcoidia bacterium]|nr:prephenate dehydrogenase/arogenate dehydrogenase family protein [Dehalococcoidia bacterium]
MDKITIIGLGLIGGSIGMALRKSNSRNIHVVGYDAEPSVGKRAVKRGAVDKSEWRLHDAVDGASMVILAVPVLAIREMLELISDMIPPGCVITDTGSTKESVLSWAEEYLPKEVSFVGGHPMAGKELSGINEADGKLFENARYVVIPGRNAGKEAVKTVLDLVKLLGARPYFLDAHEHDSYVAAVSHLPILLSTILVSSTVRSPAWREMSKLAATGFRDVSRLASGDPVMNLDICVTNRDAIIYWMNEAIRELATYRDMIDAAVDQDSTEKLGDTLVGVWEAREKWLSRYESGDDADDRGAVGPELPSASEQMADLFLGSRIRERYQQVFSLQARQAKERERRRLRRP